MKRVLAAVVAIGLIAAGFFVNGRRTDPERGREPLVLWCVPDAAEACNGVASSRVLVSIRTPSEIERDVTADRIVDAVVTSGPWLDRLEDQRRLAVAAPLAHAPLVIVTRTAEPPACASAACFLKGDRKVALPEPTSLAASLVVAGAVGSDTVDTLTSKQLTFAQVGGTPMPGVEPLTALVTVRLVDAVVTLGPATRNISGVKATAFTPALSLALKIGTIREDPRIDDLTKELRDVFTDLGWEPRTTDSPQSVDATTTLEAYGILNP